MRYPAGAMNHPIPFIELLEQSTLLTGIPTAWSDPLVGTIRPMPFETEGVLATPETEGGEVIVLLAGSVREEVAVDGQRCAIAVIGPGALVGGLLAFDPATPRHVEVVGEERGLAALVPWATLVEARRQGHALALNLEELALTSALARAHAAGEALGLAADRARWPPPKKKPAVVETRIALSDKGGGPAKEDDPRLLALRSVPGLQGIPPKMLGTLASGFELLAVSDQVLFRPGDLPVALWVLAEGSVEMQVQSPGGRMIPAELARPGAALGLRGCLAWSTHGRGAAARGAARLLALPLQRLQEMLGDPLGALVLRRMALPALARATAAMDRRAAALGWRG